MREIVLTVPAAAQEDVIDRLLPELSGGVRAEPAGRAVHLRIAGPSLPSRALLARAAGRWPHRISERELPDDPALRRAAEYRPDVIGGRLVVRPEWAPASGAEIELVVGEAVGAFGAGGHPTTRGLLERLLGETPRGSFADLGCGNGVLGLLAARLGFAPVRALDVNPESVAAAAANVEANRLSASMSVAVADLMTEGVPSTDGFVANVPAPVHRALAAGADQGRDGRGLGAARWGWLSGFGAPDADAVVAAYARGAGLQAVVREDVAGWCVIRVARPE